MVDKALVIRNDKGKFRDISDVVAVARAEGKKLFKNCDVGVVRLFFDCEVGWVAVIRCPNAGGCSASLGVSEGEKMRNES